MLIITNSVVQRWWRVGSVFFVVSNFTERMQESQNDMSIADCPPSYQTKSSCNTIKYVKLWDNAPINIKPHSPHPGIRRRGFAKPVGQKTHPRSNKFLQCPCLDALNYNYNYKIPTSGERNSGKGRTYAAGGVGLHIDRCIIQTMGFTGLLGVTNV